MKQYIRIFPCMVSLIITLKLASVTNRSMGRIRNVSGGQINFCFNLPQKCKLPLTVFKIIKIAFIRTSNVGKTVLKSCLQF